MQKDIFEFSCFDWEDSQDDDVVSDSQELNPATDTLLWSPGKTLMVSFKDKAVPAVTFDDDNISKRTIIDWMNEWSEGTDGTSVPKFKPTKIFEDGDIRIEFTKGKLIIGT